ncbi:MAG: efflux RND transporter permease subunit [Acidobacteriaceae bacterium]|jgi:multidrug efflux pump subunit AcrB|nr:efflux RND transporter permease subunit [Acidobacteriaceae bacterium]
MWIVQVALRRPYTFVVLALLIFGLGPLAISRTPTDIFPNIDIPVVAAVWNYGGLSAQEMTDRLISNFERSLTTAVNDIEHVESQSLRGISVVKIFMQPGAKVDLAVAQVTAVSQAVLRQMPQGTIPPFILQYNASSVPVLQLALYGNGMAEQQLLDLGMNFLRPQLASVPGAQLPFPYGGKQPQVQVDLDPSALQAKGLGPADVVNAIASQNLILPGGTSKIGSIEYDVDLNASPTRVEQLNDLPIKMVGTTPIYIRDVAHVRNGYPPQTNIARLDGQRSVLMVVQKVGNTSTLDIIARVKSAVAQAAAGFPASLVIKPLADQSLFVRASIQGVLREAVIAAVLTALMILLFLGSWRSTIIIAVSIPLSIFCSIITLSAIGETINIMTLGGLALAVGILVDDATVAIENINRHLGFGKDPEQAILDGAQQIAVPAFVSTLCICIVFVPMFFLTGVGRYLFVPMAEAVVFAMLASYVLSRTVVPTMAKYLLRADEHASHEAHPGWFDRNFEKFRLWYRGVLTGIVQHRVSFVLAFLGACLASLLLIPVIGQDFFPSVDGGQFKLHLRAPTGTRIEETAAICDRVQAIIREIIPSEEIASVIDNIGLPYSGINLSYTNSAPIGSSDADILVALSEGHKSTPKYVHDLRLRLNREMPGVMFSFLPADIVTQILNFGLPSPIDVQVVGRNLEENRRFASSLAVKLSSVPGMVDLRVHQAFNQPLLHLDVDRTRAATTGLTQRDVANNLLVSLSGSGQTAPTFWLNPATGVSYTIATQMPQYRVGSLEELGNIPVTTAAGGASPQILQSLASVQREAHLAVVSHYNAQPVIDIFGGVYGRDLGSVAREMQTILDAESKHLPRGSQLVVRGQVETMRSSFSGLLAGLALAVILVYLLIVVNFQSWLDPFIIISALPAALAGIVWMLFLSQTTFSVPSLTGAIMCIGVATANSILVVSFAKDEMESGRPAIDAAIDAGFTRFRPVLMTALAMIIGMVPMALGFGEGGEQNAPLGRAVIGGLGFATVATLVFVPAVFAILHGKKTRGIDERA